MSQDDPDIEDLVDSLDETTARRLLADAAAWHEEVARTVRLAAAGPSERLAVLREEVDDGLRTRRHLGYHESTEWAVEAQPVVNALADAVASDPSRELVELLQRAAGHVVKVILRADDSNGMIGDVARQLLDLHATACDSGVADPSRLAKWMVKFCFVDQDFFELDPVRYAEALGDKGLSTYRREVEKRSTNADQWATRYATERLAILDRDVAGLVDMLGGDQTKPHQFQRVAEAMVELDLAEDALVWARRGIAETSGWQVGKLYDLAADILTERGESPDVLTLRQEQHDRTPSSTTYATLKQIAAPEGEWAARRQHARNVLGDRDPGGLVDALLADGDLDEAWMLANTMDADLVGERRWLALAEARQPTHPSDSLDVYFRLVDGVLVTADRRAYRTAVKHLRAARRAATQAGEPERFVARVAELREVHRRRPSLIAMLDKAGFT